MVVTFTFINDCVFIYFIHSQSTHTECLSDLATIVKREGAREPENIGPTENAISAVAKICKFQGAHVPLTELLPEWIGWLPIWDDDDELELVYGYLCDLVERYARTDLSFLFCVLL